MPKTVGLIPERRKIVEIEKVYSYIKREIIQEMRKMSIAKYSEIAAIVTRNRITRLVELANKKTYQWAKDAIPAAYDEAARKARISLDILGAKKDPLFNTKIHTGSMDRLIDETMAFMTKANGSMKNIVNSYLYLIKKASEGMFQLREWEGWEEAAEEWIREEILEGVQTGASRQVVAATIRDYLMDQVDEDGLINVKGRRYQPRYYAELVARTEMRKAQSEAVINSCREYETDLVEVSSHGTETKICKPYEGNVYSISGNSTEFPYLDQQPPFHPNCQHFLYPTSPEVVGTDIYKKYKESPWFTEGLGNP